MIIRNRFVMIRISFSLIAVEFFNRTCHKRISDFLKYLLKSNCLFNVFFFFFFFTTKSAFILHYPLLFCSRSFNSTSESQAGSVDVPNKTGREEDFNVTYVEIANNSGARSILNVFSYVSNKICFFFPERSEVLLRVSLVQLLVIAGSHWKHNGSGS